LRYDEKATRAQKLFDLGQRQFAKFAKSYGQDADKFPETLEFRAQDAANGRVLMETKIVGGKLKEFVTDFWSWIRGVK